MSTTTTTPAVYVGTAARKSGGPDGMAAVQLCFRLLQYHPSSVRDAS